MTKIKIEIKKKKSDEKIEHSFITIRNENKYFSTRPFPRVRSFLKFRLSRENGASNKQRTGKYFDEYIYHGRTILAKYHFADVSLADLRWINAVISGDIVARNFRANKFLRFPPCPDRNGSAFRSMDNHRARDIFFPPVVRTFRGGW